MLSRRELFQRGAALWGAAAFMRRAWGAEQGRLPRNDLLLYRTADGSLRAAGSPREWDARRKEILAGMQEVMGPLPGPSKRCPLDARVEEETDCGGYVRRLLTYASEPMSRTPAYVLEPKGAKKPARAALCLHPTDLKNGHKTILGLAPSSYAKYAVELAERGWVVIAPAYPLMADYQPDLKALGYQSGTMKAIWDNIRALDYLASLPDVRKGGFAAIGHSLGGHNSIYTAVFEQRIRAVVTSCGFDSFLDYYDANPAVWQLGKGWVQDRYMAGLAQYAGKLEAIPFDFYELIAALAPRSCFINAPLRDGNFRWQSVRRIVEAARKVYELHGAAEELRAEHPDAAHEFPEGVRKQAYETMERALGA